MYPMTLKSLLADPTFAPGQVKDASDLSDDWFKNGADLASFVFRSIFRDMIDRGFTNQQGIPAADWQRFMTDVKPRMLAVLNTLPNDPIAELRSLALAYHSTL